MVIIPQTLCSFFVTRWCQPGATTASDVTEYVTLLTALGGHRCSYNALHIICTIMTAEHVMPLFKLSSYAFVRCCRSFFYTAWHCNNFEQVVKII